MNVKDLHNRIALKTVIAPVAAGTTGTGQAGNIIDRKGFNGVELIFSYGAITGTGATFTVTVKEGDTTGAMTSVAAADLNGTESDAGLAAGTRTDGDTEKVHRRIGYKGLKRYVQASIVNTVTAATPVGCVAVLYDPAAVPTSGNP